MILILPDADNAAVGIDRTLGFYFEKWKPRVFYCEGKRWKDVVGLI